MLGWEFPRLMTAVEGGREGCEHRANEETQNGNGDYVYSLPHVYFSGGLIPKA